MFVNGRSETNMETMFRQSGKSNSIQRNLNLAFPYFYISIFSIFYNSYTRFRIQINKYWISESPSNIFEIISQLIKNIFTVIYLLILMFLMIPHFLSSRPHYRLDGTLVVTFWNVSLKSCLKCG